MKSRRRMMMMTQKLRHKMEKLIFRSQCLMILMKMKMKMLIYSKRKTMKINHHSDFIYSFWPVNINIHFKIPLGVCQTYLSPLSYFLCIIINFFLKIINTYQFMTKDNIFNLIINFTKIIKFLKKKNRTPYSLNLLGSFV